MFRHPRTFGERRAAAAVVTDDDLADLGIRITPRRGRAKASLPSERDDKAPSRTRSWKAHRRAQHSSSSGSEHSSLKCSLYTASEWFGSRSRNSS